MKLEKDELFAWDFDLQMFADDDWDDDDDDDDDDLDDFDLDDDDDDDSAGSSNEPALPKSKVSKIVQKRLAKERSKYETELAARDHIAEGFRQLYGVSVEDALLWANQQRQQAAQQQQPTQQQTSAQQVPDPVTQKVMEIDNWRREEDARRQREAEALEFVRLFPDVQDKDIPPEVIARRNRGGVTITEAYKAYMFDQATKNAASRAAQDTARNISSRRNMRTEGIDYSGNGGRSSADMLDPELRKLGADFGLSPKEIIAYQRKAEKAKQQQQ